MPKIKVKIKPRSKITDVSKKMDMHGNECYIVKVKAPPIEGKANKELLDLLSEYFGIPKTFLKIKSGFKSRNKVILVPKIRPKNFD